MRENDFPILNRKIRGKKLVYLDNAATSQIPYQVFDAIIDFETKHRANIHRGVHTLSEEATTMYEDARKTVARFINAVVPAEIIFVRNTTEAVNLAGYSWGRHNLKKGDIVLATEIEHHSNLLPWQNVCKEVGARLEMLATDKEGFIHVKNTRVDWSKVKLVVFPYVSNVLGTIQDVKQISKDIKKEAFKVKSSPPVIFVDAAQSVPHMPVNVHKLGVDFLAFSGHKMCGTFGIGILWVRRDLFGRMSPFLVGGGMIKKVEFTSAEFVEMAQRYDAGTPNVSGAIGLAAACDYLTSIGLEKIREHEKKLTWYALKKLAQYKGVEIYGPLDSEKRGGVISFNLKGIPAHDLASILDSEGIAIRSGQHCAMPWHKRSGVNTSARASLYFYNTKKDIDSLIKGLDKARRQLT